MSTAIKAFRPARSFFRVSSDIQNITQGREIFKVLGSYGELLEYKFMRCPETLKYLNYGFIVFKNQEDALKATNEQFIKVESEVFDKPVEVKVEIGTAGDRQKPRYNDRNNSNRR
ncbi:hypothetical protein BDB01DRAFT_714573 [Pilobolus umbonatus]|nr:hypothetical protein BDB01DRAFT_714573 [Pilobolus umbonatus]